tara:strand:+ start:2205 stop:2510 length:306 start_codon:yes stop_codon:yes gene_type:complete
MDFIKPTLTEFSTKFYIRNSLKEVRRVKDKYITIGVNIGLFILLIAVGGGLLYWKYKGKLTPQQKKVKEQEKKMYLFQKLHQISYEKEKASQNLITNLPLV